MSIGKMGRYVCDECGDTIDGEVLWVGWGHTAQPGPEAAKLHFCCSECMADQLYSDVHIDRRDCEIRDILDRLCKEVRNRYGAHLRLEEILGEIL
jgi:hypothetical protein